MRRYLALAVLALAATAGCSRQGSPVAPIPAVGPAGAPAAAAAAASAAKYRVLYSFKGGRDGAAPFSPPVEFGGVLYGTTTVGGTGCRHHGCGTVYSIDGSGRESVVYRFPSAATGANPQASLTAFRGALYGATNSSTATNSVFRILPSGDFKTVYRFAPWLFANEPLVATNSNLYGTMDGAPSSFYGEVFSLSPAPYRFSSVHTFSHGGLHGPHGALLSWGGSFYGVVATSPAAIEAIYEVRSNGAARKLYAFPFRSCKKQAQVAEYPSGLIALNGKFYGTTEIGRNFCRWQTGGTVFSFDPSTNAVRVLHEFALRDGLGGESLATLNGKLYGVTHSGDAGDGGGVLFELDPNSGAYRELHRFGRAGDAGMPYGGLSTGEGTVYGATIGGGANNAGAIYAYTP